MSYGRTHKKFISALRGQNTVTDDLAADLLELHDRTSISLDNWHSAKEFIRERVRAHGDIIPSDFPFPNGA